jgi:menaquinone-dependent protoporphyrinogen IX oxidase
LGCAERKAGETRQHRCDPRNYALVVIGSPVWVGRMTPAVRAYLERYRDHLAHVAFFVTSGDTDAAKVVGSVEAILGHKAKALTGFNAKELADRGARSDKIATFVQALRQREGFLPGDTRTGAVLS